MHLRGCEQKNYRLMPSMSLCITSSQAERRWLFKPRLQMQQAAHLQQGTVHVVVLVVMPQVALSVLQAT